MNEGNETRLGCRQSRVRAVTVLGAILVAVVLSGCAGPREEVPPRTTIPTSPIPPEAAPSPSPTVTSVEVTPTPEEGLPLATLDDVSPGRYIAFCGRSPSNQRAREALSLFLMAEDGRVVGRVFDGECDGAELMASRGLLAVRGYPSGDLIEPRVGLLDPMTDKKVWIDTGQQCYEPAWSEAASRLAMICGFNVVVVDPDSQEETLLVDCWGRDRACNDPQWSPDGKTVSFFMAMEFQPDPGIYTASGKCGDEPTACPAVPEFLVKGTLPHAWAPSGDLIAYATFEGDIGIVDRFGRRVQVIELPAGALVNSLAWSSGGDKLAFTMQHGESAYEVYLMTYPEGELTQLTDTGSNSTVEFWVDVPR